MRKMTKSTFERELEKETDSPRGLIEAIIQGTTVALDKANIQYTIKPETEKFLKATESLRLIDLKDVLSVKEKAKKEILRELNGFKLIDAFDLTNKEIISYNQALEKAKQIIKEHL